MLEDNFSAENGLKEKIDALVHKWVGAARGREKDQQVQIIRDLSALAENVDAVQYMSSSEKCLDAMAHMIAEPPNDDGKLLEGAVVAMSKVLANIAQNLDPLKSRHGGRLDVGDIAKAARSIASKVPKLARGMYDSLFLTMEEGSQKGQQSAAWALHFIASLAPDDGLKFNGEHRKHAAEALVSLLGSMWADVKVAALHAVSMCMQRDVLFRADVAQAGAVTLFMRMIRDDNAALVTAATGALHALVQGHKAYVPWIVQIQGISELLRVLERLPANVDENAAAVLQTLWTLECIANADAANAKLLLDEGTIATLVHVIMASHGWSDDIQGAAAMVIAGIVSGKEGKEPRPALRTQVIDEIEVPVLADFQEHGCKALQLLAESLLQAATPEQKARGRRKPPAVKLNPASGPYPQPPTAPKPEEHHRPTGPVKGQLNIFSTKEALVIGLGNYENLSKVKTAVRDAQDLAGALEKSGFRVLTCYDSAGDVLKATVIQFEQRLVPGCLALISFVGHGAMFDGKRFLLPTDFKPHASLYTAAGLPVPAPPGAAPGEAGGPAAAAGAGAGAGQQGEEPSQPAVKFSVPEPGVDPAASQQPQLKPTEQELKEIRASCVNLDASLDKLMSKGVRHTLLLLDPCRKCRPPGTVAAALAAAAAGTSSQDASSAAAPDTEAGKAGAGAAAPAAAASKSASQPSKPTTTQIYLEKGPGEVKKKARSRDVSPSKKAGASTPRSDGKAGEGKKGGKVAAGSGANGARALARNGQSLKGGAAVAALAGAAGIRQKLVDALEWTHEGVKASLVVWAAGPGSESFGAGKLSTSSKLSLFGEQVVKYMFAKRMTLRIALQLVVKTVKEATNGEQQPGFEDDQLIGPEFRLGPD